MAWHMVLSDECKLVSIWQEYVGSMQQKVAATQVGVTLA